MDTKIIPFGKYCIDSAKFYIDKDIFSSVNIPENFVLTDADTGEIIDDFKKNSLSVPYKNHKIYISNVVKYLKNNKSENFIEKVMFYFPAKVSDDYFGGITKQVIYDVIEFIKRKGYWDFTNIDKVFKAIYVKDLDVKMDRKYKRLDLVELKEWNKTLAERFNGDAEDFHSFDSKKQGFGISTFDRSKATITKPFLKFYDKSKEVKKDMDFFNSLSPLVQEDLIQSLVYRFEFTMKEKSFFDKHGLSNRLEDIFEVQQDKWNEVGRAFLRYCFEVTLKPPRDVSKLRPIEKILMLLTLDLHEEGWTTTDIRSRFVDTQLDKKQKQRMRVLFNRIWYSATIPGEMTKELVAAFNRTSRWDYEFGLTDRQRVYKTS